MDTVLEDRIQRDLDLKRAKLYFEDYRCGISVIHCVVAVGINAGIITYALQCAARS